MQRNNDNYLLLDTVTEIEIPSTLEYLTIAWQLFVYYYYALHVSLVFIKFFFNNLKK